jgi:hypothetical protein
MLAETIKCDELTQVIDESSKPKKPRLQPMEQEYVIAFVGPRGSGKTLGLVYYEIGRMSKGKVCSCTVPIKKEFKDIGLIQSKPFDSIYLYQLDGAIGDDKQIVYGQDMGIDEFDKLCSSRHSLSVGNQLLNWIGTQIRKFGLNFTFSAQELMWVDTRWRFQVDVVIVCKDLTHTPWGKDNDIERGTMFNLKCLDWSGVVTGDPYKYCQEAYASYTLKGRDLWDAYDTRKAIGVDEMLRKFSINRKEYEVSLNDNLSMTAAGDSGWEGIQDGDIPPRPPNKHEIIQEVLEGFALAGYREVTGKMIDEVLYKRKINIHYRDRGVICREFHIPSRRTADGVAYDLTDFTSRIYSEV